MTLSKRPALFLDRDGVINIRTPGDYVRTPEAFQPVEGLEEAMRLLASYFGRIVVVTNQAGIGRGLMTESDLAGVHARLLQIVGNSGGRIDAIYYCPHHKNAGCRCRKPATGMVWTALAEFSDIDLENAWLAGDSASDIALAENLGMRTVLIAGKFEDVDALRTMRIDFQFDSLLQFAHFICNY
jgi:D-glycero-D-manno-heptose 1,7-bisphosphate phosphatase